MPRRTTCFVVTVMWLLGLFVEPGQAQQPSRDEVIDQICTLQNINTGDQRRIADWVEAQVDKLAADAGQDGNAAFREFRDTFNARYTQAHCTAQFRTQLATQTSNVSADWFAKADLNATVGRALSTVLGEMNRLDSFDGLLAGLRTKDAGTRFLCAKALTALGRDIAADKARLDRAVQALREAGLAESSPVVLGQIYLALAYRGHAATVFDVYMALFDKRLALRRGPGLVVDRAEVDAVEYFRNREVLAALNPTQKAELARRLAVFLRADAQRYDTLELDHVELVVLEHRLDGLEAVLSELAGGKKGGDIRGELEKGSHQRCAEVLQQAYLWVGNPETKDVGVFNEAPWNVPVGAP